MHLRHLPVLQNWDCQSCGNCCREYHVAVTDEERRRIEGQGWDQDPATHGRPLFVRHGPWWAPRYRLAHYGDSGCVFLGPGNRCRIHERFGADAKPLACRLFPFAPVPADDHWRVGLRFACPSVAANQGRPLAEHRRDLVALTRQLEEQEGLDGVAASPALHGRQRVGWPDLMRLLHSVSALLKDRRDRVERRWRKCLALDALCRQARLENLSGGRLAEFLDLVAESLDADVPLGPADVATPTWVGRVLFRQVAAVQGRKDHGERRGRVTRSRLALLHTGWRFARGRGAVPHVNGLLRPGVTFEQMEAPAGPLSAAAEELLERYYLVKVESLQFCGPTNFGLSFWDGLESLALTLPIILWLARGLLAESGPAAVAAAVGFVDDHFGYNRVLRTRRHRWVGQILARRGELERLIAWYSR
jgi:lysine-N-methylase